MDELAALKNSIADRALALREYALSLRADSARSDEGFNRALEICAAYARAFTRQLEVNWNHDQSHASRKRVLEESLRSFIEREQWIDRRFARGSQSDVPRALKTIARQHFRRHALENHEPVLTVGPPDEFETYAASLAEYLFDDIWIELEAGEEQLRSTGSALAIFSVPYIEGTRALWYPVVLGHEVAHIRLDRLGSGDRDALLRRLSGRRDVEYGELIEASGDLSRPPELARRDLEQQITSWVTELICDLNAVRLFGPAGLSAIAEVLTILDAQGRSLDLSSHPPLYVRLRLLFSYLGRLGWTEARLPAHAMVWMSHLNGAVESLDKRSAHVAHLVMAPDNMRSIEDLVHEWGDQYLFGDCVAAVDYVTSELLDGIPGGTHVPADGESWRPVSVADVVNSAWAARRILEEVEAGSGPRVGVLLTDPEMPPHEKRLRLDSLASKAIDTLELARLWGPDRGVIAGGRVELGDPSTSVSPDGRGIGATRYGVLSRRSIAKLIKKPLGSADRLVVTPLFVDTIQDSAIDLRLGPDFIVFRHSATGALDPVRDGGDDPRIAQERVYKGWGEQFVLHPQEIVLASTLEYLVVPEHVAAQVLTRSSYGRLGLLTATAVQVQPGSRGCITLELVNQGETPIALSPGARVAQLMSWFVDDPCAAKQGKYWFPVGPQFSKVRQDRDAAALRRLADAAQKPAAERRSRMLMARFVGNRDEAEDFYAVALSLGATETQLRPGRNLDASRRLTPGEARDWAEAGLAVSGSISILSSAVLRWVQARRYGATVRVTEDALEVAPNRNLPAGQTIVRLPNGDVRGFTVPPDTADDIAQVLRASESQLPGHG